MKKLLSNRLYMSLMASDLLSNFGDMVYYLALMNYVLQLPDTKLALSIVNFSEIFPVFLSLLTGYLSDRTRNKLTTIKFTQLFRVVLYVGIGCAMTFEPALWIVILASVFNVFGDFAGQYENGLYIPISLRVVSDEERADSMALSQSVFAVSAIFFQTISAALISFFTYSQLAFLNAGTFLISFLILVLLTPSIKKLLTERPMKMTDNKDAEGVKGEFDRLWSSLSLAVKELTSVPELRLSMIIVPVVNSIFVVLPSLLVLMMSQDRAFMLGNASITLAAVNIAMTVGMIVGSILVMNLLKKMSILSLLRMGTLGVFLMFFSLFLRQPYFLLVFLALTGIATGAINPKYNALIYNRLPEEQLATIEGGLMTYFQLGTVFSRLLVSTLILVLTVNQLVLLFLLAAFFLLLYSLKRVPLMTVDEDNKNI